jgi:autotransporter-associated beta strand protein
LNSGPFANGKNGLPDVKPGDIAAMLPKAPPEQNEAIGAIIADLDRVVMRGMTQWNHPNFFAYFANTASMPGILAELVCAALNNNAMLWSGNFGLAGTRSLNLGTGAVTLTTAASPQITVSTASATVGGVISESGFNTGLTKLGGGVLVLANTANAYTGVTDITGTLNVASLSDYGVASSLGNRSLLQESATGNGIGVAIQRIEGAA